MFQAMGRAVQRNRDDTLTVKVEFVDDRTGRSVRVESFIVATLEELRPRVLAALQAMRDGEQDVQLNAAVVDVVLGAI